MPIRRRIRHEEKSKLEIVRARSKAVHWRILVNSHRGLVSIQLVADWFGIQEDSVGMDSSGQIGLVRKKQATSRLGLAIGSGLDPKGSHEELSLHRSPVTLAMTVKSELMEVHGTSLHTSLAYSFVPALQGSTCPQQRGASVWPRMARHPV